MSDKFPAGLSYLRPPVESEIPGEIREFLDGLYEQVGAQQGYVPNLFKVLALNPHQFRGWVQYISTLFGNPDTSYLDPIEQEMMGLVVSAINRCNLCLSFHADSLRGLTKDPVWVEQLANNYRSVKLTERQRAMCDFASFLTLRPNESESDQIDKLRAVGLNDNEILETVMVASYFNFSNRFATALGIKANDEHFFSNRNFDSK